MGAGLSAEEREAASQAKLTEKEIKVVVKAFKKNKKQSLTATQFSLLMYDIKNKLPGENFKHFSWADHDNLFRMFDTNHDGTGAKKNSHAHSLLVVNREKKLIFLGWPPLGSTGHDQST